MGAKILFCYVEKQNDIMKCFIIFKILGIYSQEECELRTHLIYTSVLENLGENGIIMGQYIDLLPLYSIEFSDIVSKELSNYKTGKIFES